MEQNDGCLTAFGKGSFKALLVFTVPALLVYVFYDEVESQWNGISKLPIFRQMQQDFRSGAEVVGAAFGKELQLYYADTLIADTEVVPEETYQHASYWDRENIERNLIRSLPRGYHANVRVYMDYIERYKDLAGADMRRTKVPASVTLAQGLLESDAGRSRLARTANNHFGIKCRAKPGFRRDGVISDGDFTYHSLAIDCMQAHDDYAWDRFEVYPSAKESFRRHSLLLREPRYNWMLKSYPIGGTYQIPKALYGHTLVPYYAAWSAGLKSSGYATAKVYAEKLTLIIETYQLWKVDYETIGGY